MKCTFRSLILAFALQAAGPAQWDRLPAFEELPDLTFPSVIANGTGDGMLSDLQGRSLVVVLVSLEADEDTWALVTDLLRRAPLLEDRSVRTLLWIIGSRDRDVEAEIMNRFPWLQSPVVLGDLDFVSAPQLWAIGPDGRRIGRQRITRPMHRQLDRLVQSAVRAAGVISTGWGTIKALRRARALAYGKGRLADAHEISSPSSPPAPEEQDARAAFAVELDELFLRRLRRIKRDIDEGHWQRARAACTALAEDVRGWEPKEDVALETLRPLTGPNARPHLVFERNLARWLKRLRGAGPSPRLADSLKRLLRKAPDGAVKDRARRLHELVTRANRVTGGK